MAARIRARAMRRAGELLKQIEPNPGGRPSETKGHASPSYSRKQAMAEAGMSVDQGKTALRVASIPDRQFTEQVESANPPTLTERGRGALPHGGGTGPKVPKRDFAQRPTAGQRRPVGGHKVMGFRGCREAKSAAQRPVCGSGFVPGERAVEDRD